MTQPNPALRSTIEKKASAVISSLRAAVSSLREENQILSEKVAHFEKQELCRDLAREMEGKGLFGGMDTDEKVAHLMSLDDLDTTRRAVEMYSGRGNSSLSIGSVSDVSGNGLTSEQAFLQFCTTGE